MQAEQEPAAGEDRRREHEAVADSREALWPSDRPRGDLVAERDQRQHQPGRSPLLEAETDGGARRRQGREPGDEVAADAGVVAQGGEEADGEQADADDDVDDDLWFGQGWGEGEGWVQGWGWG